MHSADSVENWHCEFLLAFLLVKVKEYIPALSLEVWLGEDIFGLFVGGPSLSAMITPYRWQKMMNFGPNSLFHTITYKKYATKAPRPLIFGPEESGSKDGITVSEGCTRGARDFRHHRDHKKADLPWKWNVLINRSGSVWGGLYPVRFFLVAPSILLQPIRAVWTVNT